MSATTPVKARAPQEHVIVAQLGERAGFAAPSLLGGRTAERRRQFTQWTDSLGEAASEGFVKLHHTGQTADEVRRRFRRMDARAARRAMASGKT